jgi:proteasome subunit B (beta)-like protein
MKFILFLLMAFLFPALIWAQANDSINVFYKSRGTIMMAAKAKDGIIIVADSRIAYKLSSTNEVLAYQDGQPKIFPLKKFALAIAGDFSDGEIMVKKIVADFSKSNPTYNTPEECLYRFGLFIKAKYPAYFKNLNNNIIIATGYCPEQTISILINNTTRTIRNKDWSSNAAAQIDSLHLFTASKGGTSKHLADSAEQAMKEYIRIFHKEDEMGGFFSILKINPDNSYSWLKNDFSGNGYETECEANRAWYENKQNLHYIDSKRKSIMKEFNKTIKRKCRY